MANKEALTSKRLPFRIFESASDCQFNPIPLRGQKGEPASSFSHLTINDLTYLTCLRQASFKI
jgi:hypothetical protein